MNRASLPALALVALAIGGCSSSSDGAGGAGTGGASGTGGAGPEGPSFALNYTTAPGEETHFCQYTRLPKAASGEVLVTGYTWHWEDLHHWALYRTTADLPHDVDFDKPWDCFAPNAMKYAEPAAILLAAGADGEQKFPEQTGFAFASEEVVIVQAHTVNTTAKAQHPSLDFTLELAGPGGVKDRLGLIQFYDPYISVPAHADATAGMRCQIPQTMNVVFASTHQHVRGVGVRAFLDAPGAAPSKTPFIESKSWEHPNVLNEPFALAKGSYVRTVCDYHGDDHDAFQGQDKLDNEMCMFLGYYYPVVPAKDGGGLFENCVQTPIPGGVGDSYGTGKATCGESLSCLQGCAATDAPRPGDGRVDVGACWQTCLVDSCPAAAAPLDAFGYCAQNKCADACSGGNSGSDCTACVVSNCGSELGACQSTKC